ncbi:hypothetical protein E3O25_08910 [Cryobacterium sp. TMT1-3]|uniref:hypothetical protein n=1 Tax=Cryobacterium sp. TMT1-3 TaxID=1259237 RepID=UPI00106B4467|nr:hypothetical protein [Cryobacterium sp. TMT1-3]TFC27927.1 hypothetical protein E3O25_08910 [Cryobacterium sp. TMT1-3]
MNRFSRKLAVTAPQRAAGEPTVLHDELTKAAAKPTEGDLPVSARVALYGSITLALAVLAAIGIQGDVLGRLIRNQTQLFPWAIVVVLLGGAAVHWRRLETHLLTRIGAALGALLLLIGVSWMVWIGAESLALRDQPVVNLTATIAADGSVQVSADASSTSLKANDKMLLDVKTVDAGAGGTTLDWCRDSLVSKHVESAAGRSVYWEETGPSATGAAKDSIELVLDRGNARYLRASAALHLSQAPLENTGSMTAEQKAAADARYQKAQGRLSRDSRDAVVIIDLSLLQSAG